MKRILHLSIFPAIGLLLLVASLWWGKRELRLRFQGEPANGQVVGMVLQRSDHADMLTEINTRLEFSLANGDRIEAAFRNYVMLTAGYHFAGNEESRSLTAEDLNPNSSAADAPLSATLRRTIDDAMRGDGARTRWALQRESRLTGDPKRVMKIDKTETVRGYFDMPVVPLVMEMKDGEIHFDGTRAGSPAPGTAVIRAVFDMSDPAAIEAKNGESMTRYEYLINGRPHTPAKKDGFLNAEPYTTEFIPVFSFEANGIQVARLSHIGRHGGPTLALRLFEKCKVYYDPEQPTEAVLIADAGKIDGDWLGWFSRYCEGVFGQWGSTTLIALNGLMFLGVGLITISLAIKPSKVIPVYY